MSWRRTVSTTLVGVALSWGGVALAKDRHHTNATGDNTAGQASSDKSDVELAAKVRRAIVGDKSLSVASHNVHIDAQAGVVTLSGNVPSDAEKSAVERQAVSAVGDSSKVKCDVQVKR